MDFFIAYTITAFYFFIPMTSHAIRARAIGLAAVALTLLAGAGCAPTEPLNAPAEAPRGGAVMESSELQGVMMNNNEMMKINTDGDTSVMTADTIMPDGSKAMMDGKVMMNDGTEVMMKDGDVMMMEGGKLRMENDEIIVNNESANNGANNCISDGGIASGTCCPRLEPKLIDHAMIICAKIGQKIEGSYGPYIPAVTAIASVNEQVILFFHAPWCPTCRAVDADITSRITQIPDGVHILKVDYDSATELKKKYGVTYQHTFVEVDARGNMLQKWSGGLALEDVLSHLK